MTKRIITIILVLLAVFLLLIGGMWLVGRHTATKQGVAPLSFRQFLGLSSNAPTADQQKATLASIFSNPPGSKNGSGTGTSGNGSNGGTSGTNTGGSSGNGTTNTIPNQSGNTAPNNVQTSQFTNDTLSPSDNGLGNGNGGTGTGSTIGGSGVIGGSGTVGSGTGIGTGGGFTTTGSGVSGGFTSGGGTVGGGTGATIGGQTNCTAADTTIAFTPDEIAQLNALQAQFNTLNANLATNDQVAAELAAYNGYKLEEAKIAELQSFCQATTPLLTNPAMQRHVPTPFWHDATQDSETYTNGSVNYAADGTNPSAGESFLERILRINLW